jgi:uncharacterized protein YcbX
MIDSCLPSRYCGTISKIYVYPIKSCSYLSVETWQVDEHGLKYDREYMFAYWKIDKFEAVTLRNCPRLSLVKMKANLSENWFEFEYPMDDLGKVLKRFKLPCDVDDEFITKNQRNGQTMETNLWGVKFNSVDIGKAVPDSFYDFLNLKDDKKNVTLLYTPHGKDVKTYHPLDLARMRTTQFHDYFPFHIIDESSIRELNRKMIQAGYERQVEAVQFRPNFVIENSAKKQDIDLWFKVNLITKDGSLHRMTTGNRCPRCTIPNVDLSTGTFDTKMSVSKVLNSYRRIDYRSPSISFLGHYLVHHDSKFNISIGDEFHLTRRRINLYKSLE